MTTLRIVTYQKEIIEDICEFQVGHTKVGKFDQNAQDFFDMAIDKLENGKIDKFMVVKHEEKFPCKG